ncbi:hypothetical protein GCM10023160_13720 [Brachybacterium paraconglomeratum]
MGIARSGGEPGYCDRVIDDRAAQLLRERPADRTWLLCDDVPRTDFDEAAAAAGIAPIGCAWIEIDQERARQILVHLLSTSMAHGHALMPAHRARWLADQFLSSAGKFGTRFATNTEGLPEASGASWKPATEHVFDAGVIALGSSGASCYWVAEDS